MPLGKRVDKKWGVDYSVWLDGNKVDPNVGFTLEPGKSYKIELRKP
jgi:hypothetical protein